nr:MAG TPA: hypothetical protein [Caudoviricetes sp.]
MTPPRAGFFVTSIFDVHQMMYSARTLKIPVRCCQTTSYSVLFVPSGASNDAQVLLPPAGSGRPGRQLPPPPERR